MVAGVFIFYNVVKTIVCLDCKHIRFCLNPDGQDLRIHRICKYIRNRENPLIGGIGVQTTDN
jgi:hypothetical protein